MKNRLGEDLNGHRGVLYRLPGRTQRPGRPTAGRCGVVPIWRYPTRYEPTEGRARASTLRLPHRYMIPASLQRIARRLQRTPARDSRQTLKDRTLAIRLYRTFERDLELTHIRGIHFYVQHGTVTLYGTIRHELDRELLVSLVRQMAGVKGVVEHLQVVDLPFQESDSALMMRM